MRRVFCFSCLVPVLFLTAMVSAQPAMTDAAHRKTAEAAIRRGLDFLRSTQAEDGSWSAKPGPAITALALSALLDDPKSVNDPATQKALAYVISRAKPDGGIHDGLLENYNTSICLAALAKLKNNPQTPELVAKAQTYLRNLQWSNQSDPQGKAITEAHAFYGGAGYGREGRPDLSNTQMMIEGLHASGVDSNDPAYQRAMVFITRCQGVPQNKEFGKRIAPDGGFIYATSQSKEKIGELESKAGEETVDVPGQGQVSVLRTYGSMTYAGFKSYLYAKLSHNDPRVIAAYDWIRGHYTLDANPGMPEDKKLQGYFYYTLTFSRALRAWGQPSIELTNGEKQYWATDLIEKLSAKQEADGSWKNAADRWMEGDANLTTAFAVLALQEALK